MEKFTGLNSSRQTSETLERINDVVAHMSSQYIDFKNSGINAGDIMESIYNHMDSVSEYFRQTFSARGIPTDDVYCKRFEDIQTILMSVKWKKIGFTLKMNDKPLALHRQDGKKVICYRILATKEDCTKVIRENPDNYTSKLLDMEIASLYIPANKEDVCEMRVRHLSNEINLISQQQAAKEFFLKVLEYTCGGGSLHTEREFSSMIY